MNLYDIVHTLKVVPESGNVKLDRKMDIQDENRRLKRFVADLTLGKRMSFSKEVSRYPRRIGRRR
jgi:hypothetical protein